MYLEANFGASAQVRPKGMPIYSEASYLSWKRECSKIMHVSNKTSVVALRIVC